MNSIDYQLFDIVELKREHPCSTRSKKFQIVRLGADIKIMCLGCGRIMMLDRETFNKRIKNVIEHRDEKIILKS